MSTKQQNPNSNNKKILIGLAAVVGFIILAVGTFFGARFIDSLQPYARLTDEEFLVAVGQWQIADEPKVIWEFRQDGTGTVTTDMGETTYNMHWFIDQNTKHLNISTEYLYTVDDVFIPAFDRKKVSFSVVRPETEEQSEGTYNDPIVFVKKASAETPSDETSDTSDATPNEASN